MSPTSESVDNKGHNYLERYLDSSATCRCDARVAGAGGGGGAQAFSAWIHVCAIRLFVESILRYGLPPRFLAALLKPNPKTVPKLRKALTSTFGGGASFRPPRPSLHTHTHTHTHTRVANRF